MPPRAPASQVWEGNQVSCTCFLAPPGTRSLVSCYQGGTESGTGTQPSNLRHHYPEVEKTNKIDKETTN